VLRARSLNSAHFLLAIWCENKIYLAVWCEYWKFAQRKQTISTQKCKNWKLSKNLKTVANPSDGGWTKSFGQRFFKAALFLSTSEDRPSKKGSKSIQKTVYHWKGLEKWTFLVSFTKYTIQDTYNFQTVTYIVRVSGWQCPRRPRNRPGSRRAPSSARRSTRRFGGRPTGGRMGWVWRSDPTKSWSRSWNSSDSEGSRCRCETSDTGPKARYGKIRTLEGWIDMYSNELFWISMICCFILLQSFSWSARSKPCLVIARASDLTKCFKDEANTWTYVHETSGWTSASVESVSVHWLPGFVRNQNHCDKLTYRTSNIIVIVIIVTLIVVISPFQLGNA
jgi:hypothetical protein